MSSNPHSGPASTEAFPLRIADISTFDAGQKVMIETVMASLNFQ